MSGADLTARLATEILAHARREGLESGAHLPEQALAAQFRVSRTPVRLALQVLEAEGAVERHRNRGFFLRATLPPTATGAEADDAGDPLYRRIAEDYLEERLQPRATESGLARRYGVTRARLGRVLARMAREGWVERRPGQGWEFQPVLRSPEAYQQAFRFRTLIEPAALLEPAYHLPAETAGRLRLRLTAMQEGGWRTMAREEVHRLGAEFHEAIVAASGNPFLAESIRLVNRMRLLLEYRIHPGDDRARLVRTAEDHLRILDMIEAGDREGASHLLRAHLWQELRAKGR